MLKVDEQILRDVEELYPGINKTIAYFERLDLPPCPHCGSDDTAEVSIGIVGRSVHIFASTTKMRLLPNSVPWDHHGNAFEKYFDPVEEASVLESNGTSFLPDPMTATEDDLEAFCGALNAQRERARRLRRQREQKRDSG